MGSIVKGMGSSWLSGGEQLEQLKVVRIEERDVAVDPPAVPQGLVSFLEQRKTRRDREVRIRGKQWSCSPRRRIVRHADYLKRSGGLYAAVALEYLFSVCWPSCHVFTQLAQSGLPSL